ncbi:hypothetical protein EBZ38_09565 [bacterium]|nr:hypothetical protein [bacterium]
MTFPSAPGPSDVRPATPVSTKTTTTVQPKLPEYITSITNSGPEAIKLFSSRLRQTPYYRGKEVSKLTPALLKGIQLMEEARVSLRNYRGDIDRTEFLIESIAQGGAGGGSGGPSTTIQRKISTKLEAQTLIDEIYKDVLGRAPTEAEFNKYFKKLTKRQQDKPTVTTYSGGSTNVVTQKGGPDAEQYLYNQISGTDEAKARQVFNFYDVFKKALGVD